MDSVMVEVVQEVEVYVSWDFYGTVCPMIPHLPKYIPHDVAEYVRKEVLRFFDLNDNERWPMIEHITLRPVIFEAEVFYIEKEGGKKKAVKATCQNECPNFVKAWVELEAMKQFNQEKGS